MKKVGILLCILIFSIQVQAILTIDRNKKYRIQCLSYSGYIQLGSEHNFSTAIYQNTAAETPDDAYWYLNRISEGIYTIRNAKTDQYITYTGEYSGNDIRYIGLQSTPGGTASQWKIEQSGDNALSITSVSNPSHRFNVRSGIPHVVGTYHSTGTPASNELFAIYDEKGTAVTDQTGEGINPQYGTTVNGFFWENTGLAVPVVFTTDMENPVLYAIQNNRSGKYVAVGTQGELTQSEGIATRFFFVESTDGSFVIYTEDKKSHITGKVPAKDIETSYVTLADGAPADGDDTWIFSHDVDSEHKGYVLAIKNCEANLTAYEDAPYYWDGYHYWNDYASQHIGFYTSGDAGNTFTLYSSDTRHQDMLKEQGINVPNPDEAQVGNARSWFNKLSIGGKSPVYDNLYKTYMLPVSTYYRNGSDFSATVAFDLASIGKYTVCIDGNPVENGSSYNFSAIKGGQSYTISILDEHDTRIASSPITFTFLPIVEITGTSFTGSYYLPGTIRVNDPSIAGIDSIYQAAFRHRGATAASKQKKSYAIKLRDEKGNSFDRSFLGLRSDNNWILDAMAIDPARMRNRVSTDLWNDFSTAPYHKVYEPKVINGTRGKFVEVLLNGSYAGLYCMTEKVDRKQLKLKKIKPAANKNEKDTIRGSLYKSSSWSYSVFMGHYTDNSYYPLSTASNYNNNSSTWDSWELKYPDLDDGEAIDWKPLYDAVNVVASYRNDNFLKNVDKYFDIPVWRDYYLFVELLLATDNHGKNMYVYNYNQQESPKTSLTPWDLDGTWGRRWDGSNSLTSDATKNYVTFITTYEHGNHALFKRMAELDYDNWKSKLAQRYTDLRNNGMFNTQNLINRFNEYFTLFHESGADNRELKRWNRKDITFNFATEKSYISNWITRRINALDKVYGYDPTGIVDTRDSDSFTVTGGPSEISIQTDKPCKVCIFTPAGILVQRIDVQRGITRIGDMASGIYIVNGKKVFVR